MDRLPVTRLFPQGDPRIGSDDGNERIRYASDLIKILSEMYEDLSQKTNELIETGSPNQVGLPEYADEAAATAGGLTTGTLYRTAAGIVMVKL